MSALIETLSGSLTFEEKMTSIAHQMKLNQSLSAQLELSIARLQSDLSSIRDDEEAVKNWFRENMEVTGVTEISGRGIYVQAKTGAEAVQVDESILGDRWFRVKREVDKVAIKKELKAEGFIEGASIVPGKLSITMKIG